MIPTTRNEALAVLAELCDLSPDVRLGQLLAHLGFLDEDRLDGPSGTSMTSSSWRSFTITGLS
jgi:hypothetical protein